MRFSTIIEGFVTTTADWWVEVEADSPEEAEEIIQEIVDKNDFSGAEDWGLESTGSGGRAEEEFELVSYEEPEDATKSWQVEVDQGSVWS